MRYLKRSARVMISVLAIFAGLIPTLATAQSSAPDYHPSLGDLMTLAVQPRHTKLGLAGQQRNWPYAAYELSELRNAFARVARTIPMYRNIDMAAVIGAITTQPLNAVEQAIHAQDAGQFKAAYAELTSACNACHLSRYCASCSRKVSCFTVSHLRVHQSAWAHVHKYDCDGERHAAVANAQICWIIYNLFAAPHPCIGTFVSMSLTV